MSLKKKFTDKQRLDWLTKHVGKPFVVANTNADWFVSNGPKRRSPRAAIDATIRAERKSARRKP